MSIEFQKMIDSIDEKQLIKYVREEIDKKD